MNVKEDLLVLLNVLMEFQKVGLEDAVPVGHR